jgi:hypothetical protein
MIPQYLIDGSLVFPAARLEPRQNVSIEPNGDDLLSRPIELADLNPFPIRHFGNISRIDRTIGLLGQRS